MLCADNSISSTQVKEDFSLVKSKARLESIFFNEEEVQSQEVKVLAIVMIVSSMLMISLLAVALEYSQRGLTEVKSTLTSRPQQAGGAAGEYHASQEERRRVEGRVHLGVGP